MKNYVARVREKHPGNTYDTTREFYVDADSIADAQTQALAYAAITGEDIIGIELTRLVEAKHWHG